MLKDADVQQKIHAGFLPVYFKGRENKRVDFGGSKVVIKTKPFCFFWWYVCVVAGDSTTEE